MGRARKRNMGGGECRCNSRGKSACPAVSAQAIDYFNTFGGGDASTGGLTVFAAGNDASDDQWYPAYYEGAIAVAGAPPTKDLCLSVMYL
eukprot:1676013-Pleurochrysis_carterae.AAC.3